MKNKNCLSTLIKRCLPMVLGLLVGTSSFLYLHGQDVPKILGESLGIEDREIPYVLTLVNDSDFKQLPLHDLVKRKHLSLEIRMKILQNRIKIAESEAGEWIDRSKMIEESAYFNFQKAVEAIGELPKDKSTKSIGTTPIPMTTSMEVVEELIHLALLENQKIGWDVAALTALVEASTENDAVSDVQKLEATLDELVVSKARTLYEASTQEAAFLKNIMERGAGNDLEYARIQSLVAQSAVDLQAAETKAVLAKAKRAAPQAEAKAAAKLELSKALARQQSIDQSIEFLHELARAVLIRDRELAKAKLNEARGNERNEEVQQLIQEREELTQIDEELQRAMKAIVLPKDSDEKSEEKP
jgi:hypothetical protein